MRFDAVILAGGRSTRMGCDKARLCIAGETLLERQARLVRAQGASTVYVSCRRGATPVVPGTVPLFDRHPDRGPLEGIAAALRAAGEKRLLVLAVDLPAMTEGYLSWLLRHAGKGGVPMANGEMEPLAAVYLCDAAALAGQRMEEGHRSARGFAAAACAAGWATPLPVPARLAGCLVNWNRPGDWPQGISPDALDPGQRTKPPA